jgi:hypothetical protein
MHKEFPRIFNRIPFVNFCNNEFSIGIGNYAVVFGKYYIYLEGMDE